MSLQDRGQSPAKPAAVERLEKSRARGMVANIIRVALYFAVPFFGFMMVFHAWAWMNQKSPHPASYYISETILSLFIAVLFGVVIGWVNWAALNARLAKLQSTGTSGR